MALPLSLKLPVVVELPSKSIRSNPTLQFKPLPVSFTNPSSFHPKLLSLASSRRIGGGCFVTKAVEKEESTASEVVEESAKTEPESESSVSQQAGDLGEEIKKAMMERKSDKGEGGELWSGVAEEIQEIEWPAFGKVLGTTGVVIGVIVGSSVVLLTVNAILAELSDRVFAGRGVQDFFS